ncbi:MAG: hypothetical protein ACFFDK_02110 [Promethearchaeota archaeon]
MKNDQIEIDDIEAFIDGLKKSFDSLDEVDSHQGFQMQLAKAISSLREKKVSKIEPLPKSIGPIDVKKYLLKKLEDLTSILESDDIKSSKKFNLVMEIAKLREKLNEL